MIYNHGTKRKGGVVMALMKCPECGREISDKASSCPGCGCPIEEFESEKQKTEKADLLVETVKSIHGIYPTEKTKAIKELRQRCTELSFADAMNIIHKEYNGEDIRGLAMECQDRKNTLFDNVNNIQKTKKDDYRKGGIFTKVKCPRCKSIEFQVVGTKKKFSLGKALVGNTIGGLLGPAGASAGTFQGVNGKNGKTELVCCHCGKVWKQKI